MMHILFLKDTFTRAKNWVKELQRQASPNIVIAIAGNKADLANKRAVDFQVMRKFWDQLLKLVKASTII